MTTPSKSPGNGGGDRENPARDDASFKLPDTLAIAILLLPGFLTERVSEYFSTAPKLSDLELVASALAATIVNLLIALPIVLLLSRTARRFVVLRGLSLGLLVSRLEFLLVVFVVSGVTGIAWAVIDSSNVLFKWGLTQRASRADPWETAFTTNARRDRPYYVRVVTKDAGIYHGQPLYYPQGGGDRTLVLDQAQREIALPKPAPKAPVSDPSRRDCVAVGLDVHGKVLIASEQILAIEFRPKILVDGGCEYRCTIPPKAQRCPAPAKDQASKDK